MEEFDTYEKVVEHILSIPKFAKKIGIDNLSAILAYFGHPERKAPVIHVAGTNGKGSTCAFLQSIYTHAGYRVGVFTSPHLVYINERIRINQDCISDGDFVDVFCRVHSGIQKQNFLYPSFFEMMFLMAALYFQEQKVDLVIYETGMGGRLDATNVLRPSLSVITSVGLDHTQYLGDTLTEIAWEKAGIIKPDTPVVAFFREQSAAAVIKEQSVKIGAPLYAVEKKDYVIDKITTKNIDFSINCEYYKCDAVCIRATGLYQVENGVLAAVAANVMPDIKVEDCDIIEGLRHMQWDGRMEEVLPGVLLDGAHNEEAVRRWRETVETLYGDKPKRLLFAVAKDKDYADMIRCICQGLHFRKIYITAIPGIRRMDCQPVAEQFRKYTGDMLELIEDTRTAFYTACRERADEEILFLVGSLYLAGAIKGYIR